MHDDFMVKRRKAAIAAVQPVTAHVDSDGRIVVPPELAARFGLTPGAELHIDPADNGLRVRRPATTLARVYVEPTNTCNLTCRTCIRNNWDEPLGRMTKTTFARVMDGLKTFTSPLTVFFGGYGEPLSHPHIIDMVAQARGLGAEVELITNATLLTEQMSRRLIEAGLSMLWVSLDGATPESYTDVRLRDALPQLLANLSTFHTLRQDADADHRTALGIAFVAMKSNINDLPALLQIGSRLQAQAYSVSGVLPHTAEMCAESLYERTISDGVLLGSMWTPQVRLPRMDISEDTRDVLYKVLRSRNNVRLGMVSLSDGRNRCPFIEQGATFVGWDGKISPCMPLLHDHTSFLDGRERITHKHVYGDLRANALRDIWLSPEYVDFRRRVQEFEFSPCTQCGGCNMSEENKEDCFGNVAPTCGGCLWAQGVIQCP
jgi:MoaA/NifB/PqqE/SkfB family radical SAM enzyme